MRRDLIARTKCEHGTAGHPGDGFTLQASGQLKIVQPNSAYKTHGNLQAIFGERSFQDPAGVGFGGLIGARITLGFIIANLRRPREAYRIIRGVVRTSESHPRQFPSRGGWGSVWLPKTFTPVGGAEAFVEGVDKLAEERNGVNVTVGVGVCGQEVSVSVRDPGSISVPPAGHCTRLAAFAGRSKRENAREDGGGRRRRAAAGLLRTLG